MTVDATINRLAERQHGRVSRQQLLDSGVSPAQIEHRIATGHFSITLRGVYRVSGSPMSWHAALTELTLFSGTGSAVSHRAAAVLHGLLPSPKVLEFCTPRGRRPHGMPPTTIAHTSVVLPAADLTRVNGVACTTVERTLVDLGAVQPARRVADAVDTALRAGKTDLALLRYVHQRRRGRGRRGAGVLAQVLASFEATGPVESPYERRLLDALLATNLPTPRLQYEIPLENGRTARADFAWPNSRLVVEVDGHRFHSSREQRAADADRQNALVRRGWSVLRFTSDQLIEPGTGWAVSQIAAIVRSSDG